MMEKVKAFLKTRDKSFFTRLKIALGILVLLICSLIVLNYEKGPIDTYGLGKGVAAISIVGMIVLVILGVYRIIHYKKVRKIKFTRLILPIILTLLMGGVVFVTLAVSEYNVIINTYLLSRDTYDKTAMTATRDEARKITKEIESEGIVLLENKNGALPLVKGKVNVFGATANNFVYGGSGSGAADEASNTNFYKGLKIAGFIPNKELIKFYEDRYVPREDIDFHNLVGGDFNIHEPAVSEYSDEFMTTLKNYSDTAIVTFSRNSGEGADLANDTQNFIGGKEGQTYLELADLEKEMLDMVKQNFKKVIVIINSSYAMELGFLEDEAIDGAIWVGGPGATGSIAIGEVLTGETNPSGRLVDTYAYDIKSAPSYFNMGEFPYENTKKDDWYYKYIHYEEGIYVGYRYYETRYVNNETNEINEEKYREAVQYPFGYGLSYSKFEQKIDGFASDSKTINLDVKVTNNGKKSGKEVVQVYVTPPYTVGGIEKSHVSLTGFGKTKKLNPGESEIVPITISVDELASFDYQDKQAYVLEQGDYQIKVMKNAHEVLDERTYEVPKTIVFGEDNIKGTDLIAATSVFSDVAGDLKYVSRADWEGTLPTEMALPKEASKELIAALKDDRVEIDKKAEPIILAKHGLTLEELKGVSYDDPMWTKLLEQLSVKEMNILISQGGYQTQPVRSVGKIATIASDGPAGINNRIFDEQSNQYPSEVVIASTWNQELARKMGDCLAREGQARNMIEIYAPAVNIHRSPFSGRNFEYYSEDPFISGKMGAATVRGMRDQGTVAFVKHFALNDQETMRSSTASGVATWSNEQAMREIYLKAFEIAIKEGQATAVMSSFNRIGANWTGNSEELLKTVLRDEWGFQGLVNSDFYKPDYMHKDRGLASGNDMFLFLQPNDLSDDTVKTNWGQQNMRRASHNILYTYANSNIYEMKNDTMPNWFKLYLLAFIILAVLFSVTMYKVTGPKKVKIN